VVEEVAYIKEAREHKDKGEESGDKTYPPKVHL
jgi:hypothetical protein